MLRQGFFVILTLSVAVATPRVFHTQFRRMTCLTENENEVASCSLLVKQSVNDEEGETVPVDEVCIAQETKNGNATNIEEQYCRLYCNGASSVYLIGKRPSNNNKCAKFFSYKIAQKNTEWYLWRSAKCLRTEMQFDIACQFNHAKSSTKSIKDLLSKKFSKNEN